MDKKIIDDVKLFQNWEPKFSRQFIVNWEGVPTFLIKSIDLTLGQPGSLTMELYDPIAPSSLEPIYRRCQYGKQTLQLCTLGPVGDTANRYNITIDNITANTKYDWAIDELEIQKIIVNARIIDFKETYDTLEKHIPLTVEEKEKIINTLTDGDKTKLNIYTKTRNFPKKYNTPPIDLTKEQVKVFKKKAGTKE